jgi:Taurine catabolism dioxygenase TauD, TfdA family
MTTATMTKHAPLAGPSVWNGKEMQNSTRWVRDLTPAHVAELDKALQGVKDLDWSQVTRENFPLAGFDDLLDSVREELENGSGIMKLRGWPVAKYDEADLRRMYNGFGKHLGTPVFQNRSGEMMRAIRDEGAHVGATYGQVKDEKKGTTFLSSYARTLSNGELRFHTDRTDVVGLLCVRQARAGGVSKLASSPAVHNAMLQRRPDLAEVLYEDVWRSRFGEEGTTKETAYPLPLFGVRDGKFTSHYSQTFIDAAELATDVPKPNEKQREALALLRELAQELCLEMVLNPGDLQLINSHVTYHGRTPFEDDASSGNDRLLLRLWLSMPNNRPLPEGHEILWQNIDAGKIRGGIRQVTL